MFITADQELKYQQNLSDRKIAVLVLSTNNWAVIKEEIAAITAAADAAAPGSFSFVDIGHRHGWMDNLAYNDVLLALFRAVPEVKAAYGGWETPGDPLPYIAFSFLEESLFTRAVMSRGNLDLLLRTFDFLRAYGAQPQ